MYRWVYHVCFCKQIKNSMCAQSVWCFKEQSVHVVQVVHCNWTKWVLNENNATQCETTKVKVLCVNHVKSEIMNYQWVCEAHTICEYVWSRTKRVSKCMQPNAQPWWVWSACMSKTECTVRVCRYTRVYNSVVLVEEDPFPWLLIILSIYKHFHIGDRPLPSRFQVLYCFSSLEKWIHEKE